jgi:hypothetical protein
LNDRQRSRGRDSSAGLWTARQQMTSLHCVPKRYRARSSPVRFSPAGGRREALRRH